MLAQHSASAPDAKTSADATFKIWYEIIARLTPVIGTRGVDVLFARSLHLASAAFPCLAIDGETHEGTALFTKLRDRLESCDRLTAEEANYTLMITFTELLATLIGDSLTERLLSPIWAPSTTLE